MLVNEEKTNKPKQDFSPLKTDNDEEIKETAADKKWENEQERAADREARRNQQMIDAGENAERCLICAQVGIMCAFLAGCIFGGN